MSLNLKRSSCLHERTFIVFAPQIILPNARIRSVDELNCTIIADFRYDANVVNPRPFFAGNEKHQIACLNVFLFYFFADGCHVVGRARQG